MKGIKEKRTQVNFKYLESKFKEQGVTQTEVCELLGKNKTYLSYCKKNGVTDKDIAKLQDMFSLDVSKLMDNNDVPNTPNTPSGRFEDYVIAELGKIASALERVEGLLGEPRVTAVPMSPQEMAEIVLDDLLADGWCMKDQIIVEFNKHKIPLEYLSKACDKLGVTRTTSGHAENTRTYYIKNK